MERIGSALDTAHTLLYECGANQEEKIVSISLTIIHRLIAHAAAQPVRMAFAECDRRLEIVRQLRYEELLAGAAGGAAWLRTVTQPGDRVLIFFDPGLDPLVAFLAVLAARCIAVPAALPPIAAASGESGGLRAAHRSVAARSIVRDCAPSVVLCPALAREAVADLLRECGHSAALHDLSSFAVASAGACDFPGGLPEPEDIAFLQYTSGSTALPKGVVITHANITHNQAGISAFVGTTPETMAVSWLPMFHDMGLVGDALNTIWVGCTCVKFSPADFLRRPTLWMEAVAKFRGTITGGPNFALQLAATRGVPEGMTLDLSSLEICYCGAEPTRRETLDAFTGAFAPHGLRPEAVHPCYGLAESTLIVAGRKPRGTAFRTAPAPEPPAVDAFVSAMRGEAVSCGHAANDDARIFIRDAATHATLPGETIGEICVASRSVSPGYWAQVREKKERRFADTERTLATGDLGFLHEGELHVCGRLKNTLIVRGRKFLAEDLENLIEHELASAHRARAAVFAVRDDGRECVVVLIECGGAAENAATFPARVNRVLAETCGFAPDHVGVVRASTLPRTTSGKLQRHNCADLWQREVLGRTHASA